MSFSESYLLSLSFYFPFAVFGVLALLDWWRPVRHFEEVRFWRTRGLLYFGLYMVIASYAPMLWLSLLEEHRLLDITGLPLGVQIALAVLSVQLCVYAWHRAMHSIPALWRWFHQMHHSAERIDIWSAMVFHPFDVVGFSLVGSLGLVWIVGVSLPAAVITNAAIFLVSTVQHANVRTPHWLGYLIGRPEMHGFHHQRGVHAYNYCDLPFIDMLFGTYRNPKTWDAPAGFYAGGSDRVLEMLVGKDINADGVDRSKPGAERTAPLSVNRAA